MSGVRNKTQKHKKGCQSAAFFMLLFQVNPVAAS